MITGQKLVLINARTASFANVWIDGTSNVVMRNGKKVKFGLAVVH